MNQQSPSEIGVEAYRYPYPLVSSKEILDGTRRPPAIRKGG